MSESIDTLARRHGLAITGDITTNEMGLDFSVAFALATFEGEERSWYTMTYEVGGTPRPSA